MIILKNDSTAVITIQDINGVTVDIGESLHILDLFPYEYISRSLILKQYVSNGDIIVNDGTKDLIISDALMQLNVETQYEAQHILTKHTDVPPYPNDGIKRALTHDTTALIWNEFKDQSGPNGSLLEGINFTMSDHQAHDYVANGNETYRKIRSFIFDGTDSWTPVGFATIVSLAKAGTGYARLYDSTHNLIIAETTWNTIIKTMYFNSSIINLPDHRSIIEFQTRTSKKGTDVRSHFMALY